MCGISGILYHDTDRPVLPQILAPMNDAILHRGPDSAGYHFDGPVGMGIRRLAIIDVAGGTQPIANEDGTIWIVFNGEIYNHQQLRRDLERRGHRFRTHADTEAIVHLYEEYGERCVEHLHGMFAFAIWDAPRRRLLIARDRFGKKPLYFAEHDGALLWGSEIKCLLAYPGFPREADLLALHHYLTLQYVPAPQSAFRHVRQLLPAHYLIAENGRITTQRWWQVRYEPKHVPSVALREEVRATVEDAVRVRQMSEVPLGAHLSGGLDSSIVVGLLARANARPVKTFSIGFAEGAFSELEHARAVAEKFGTEHHEFTVTPDAVALLPALVRHFDEPFADAAAIPTWYLAKMTREHVTVALNGDGADEAFGGYQRHFADPWADLLGRLPAALRHSMAGIIHRLVRPSGNKPIERDWSAALRQAMRASGLPRSASVVRWGTYFLEDEKRALYGDAMRSTALVETESLLERAFRNASAETSLDRVLATDLENYLPGALLPKVDRMTMAHSLEARSPFLDHRVVELAARLPMDWKVRGMTTKWILRSLFADLLPPGIAQRGKMGFSVPLAIWFRGPLLAHLRERLLAPEARLWALLRRSAVEEMINAHASGAADHGKRLWALLMLAEWLEIYRPSV